MLKKDIGEILSVRNITKKDAAWYCLVSIIFTAVLWGWFAFTGIKFLWEWNLSLRDALLTFVTIFLLELTCGQDIRGRLWHAAYPGFPSSFKSICYGSTGILEHFCHYCILAAKSKTPFIHPDCHRHLSHHNIPNHLRFDIFLILPHLWQYVCYG